MGRAEHIRFKGPVIQMPEPIPSKWGSSNMKNWNEYYFQLDEIKLKLNCGISPTMEFIMPPIDDYEGNPHKIYCFLQEQCHETVKRLEHIYGLKVGPLELSSQGEWVVYNDPFAESLSKRYNLNIPGVAKVNASKPNRWGEIEFPTPYDAANYLNYIKSLPEVSSKIDRILQLLESRKDSQ